MLRNRRLALIAACLCGSTGMSMAQPAPIFAPPPALLVPRMRPVPAVPIHRMLSLIRPDDYPEAALDAQEQGAVMIELEVTPEGRPAACRILETSDSVSLDTATCQILMRRARFRPARDEVGRPIADKLQQNVRWQLDALPFAPFGSVTAGRFDAVGANIQCFDQTSDSTCNNPEFELRTMAVALTGRAPVSLELVQYLRFNPGDGATPPADRAAAAGQRLVYAGAARVTVNHNGKVIDCVELPPTSERSGALCKLARSWLFEIDPAKGDKRGGVWSVALFSSALASLPLTK